MTGRGTRRVRWRNREESYTQSCWCQTCCITLPIRSFQLSQALLPVPFLLPGVGVVVIAAPLPEAGAVMLHELEAVQPFGALVEVEFGNDQAHGAAVFGFQFFSVMLEGNNHIIVVQIGQWQIGGVVGPGMLHDKLRLWQGFGAL